MDLVHCLTAIEEGCRAGYLIYSAAASLTRDLEFGIQLLPFVFSVGSHDGLMAVPSVHP